MSGVTRTDISPHLFARLYLQAFLSPREDLLGGSRAGGAAGTAGSYLVTCSKDGLVKVRRWRKSVNW
jgi:hypothetical protein